MRKEKFRKFLPSLIPIDLTNINATFVEIGFLLDNGHSYNKVERSVDLNPGGVTSSSLLTVIPHKECEYIFGEQIPDIDAISLLGATPNKIKKYCYHLLYENREIFVNNYTLGLVIINIDVNIPLETLPSYCGLEITDDPKYKEIYLSNMRQELRDKNKERNK